MGLKIGEVFRDRCLITVVATGVAATLLADVTCNVMDESGNWAGAAVATEDSNGWYHYDFTPDAAGTWATHWSKNANPQNYNFYYFPKEFLVGAGQEADIYTRIGAPVGASISADIADIEGKVDDLETRLTAIRAGYLDELDFDLDARLGAPAGASLAADLVDIEGKVDDLEGRLTAARAGYIDKIANHLITRTWFSDTDDSITCNTDSTDLTLPSVVLPNITGTIVHAYAGLKFRMIQNTAAGGTNGLNGVQDVQVKESVAGAYTDAINLADNQWLLAISTREGGDVVIGDIDIVGQVAAFNKTYNFIIDDNDVDLASLVLNDVQTFLIVSYY